MTEVDVNAVMQRLATVIAGKELELAVARSEIEVLTARITELEGEHA